ncbi:MULTISPECIES: methanogen output domain 1-containing protein [Pontibacillus]|uniref:Methanogen output domain 1-containing protein n=1 Tax=Pontibacillus chungwhensis TaxID=265426 RepID=A0ABY8V525_9BACI|nr:MULTISPECIES: methanogen output domain 1-containing protein [Pontibacillus]MCD5322398.1 methanogen output domain 1-containing protein [Pontibacillus sp. HN14]WIF99684.1 methanogen output domain 1-containing protein [Pontibacillus chungwhensis]
MSQKQTLTAQTFLSKLLTQYASIHEKAVGAQAEEYIKQLGIRTGEWLEGHYVDDKSTRSVDQYVNVILAIKNDIGGHFEIEEVTPERIVVKGIKCPFGEMVKDAPHLCQMTSSVFGGVASRHFGYSKVHLERRIATGDDHCRVVIHLSQDENEAGQEYYELPVTPKNGDPFQWEEETIKMLGEELRKSDEMIAGLVAEIEELRSQVRIQERKSRRDFR